MQIYNGAVARVPIVMVDATDDETPETGLTVQVFLSKNGAALTSVVNGFAEVGQGLYYASLTAAETDTDGFLFILATATGADIWRDYHEVVSSAATPTSVGTVSGVTNTVAANMIQVSGDAPAADALETMLDGTGGSTLYLGAASVSGYSTLSGALVLLGGIQVTQSITNRPAIAATGNGAAAGFQVTGGSGGYGAHIRSTSNAHGVFIEGAGSGNAGLQIENNSVGGFGIHVVGENTGLEIDSTSGVGLEILGNGTSPTIWVRNEGTGTGILVAPNASHGIAVLSGGTSAHGLIVSAAGAAGTSYGFYAIGNGSGDFRADSIIGSVTGVTNSVSANVTTITGVTNSVSVSTIQGVTNTVVATLSKAVRSMIADDWLARSIAGGSDGGRTNQDAMRLLRNRRALTFGTMNTATLTAFQENDSTTAWTAIVSTGSAVGLTDVDAS